MTGEERLAIALELHELSCDVTRAGIRARYPDAPDEAIEQKLRERIALSRRIGEETLEQLLTGKIRPKGT